MLHIRYTLAIPQFSPMIAKTSCSCLFGVIVGTFNASVPDDLWQQFDALKQRKSMMPEGVKPLRAENQSSHKDRDYLLLPFSVNSQRAVFCWVILFKKKLLHISTWELVDCCCRTLTACGPKNVFSCECKNLRKMDYQTVTLIILALSSAELPWFGARISFWFKLISNRPAHHSVMAHKTVSSN